MIFFLVLIVPTIILGIYAQMKVQGTYNHWVKVPSRSRITGREAAEYVLRKAGIHDVAIRSTRGSPHRPLRSVKEGTRPQRRELLRAQPRRSRGGRPRSGARHPARHGLLHAAPAHVARAGDDVCLPDSALCHHRGLLFSRSSVCFIWASRCILCSRFSNSSPCRWSLTPQTAPNRSWLPRASSRAMRWWA